MLPAYFEKTCSDAHISVRICVENWYGIVDGVVHVFVFDMGRKGFPNDYFHIHMNLVHINGRLLLSTDTEQNCLVLLY